VLASLVGSTIWALGYAALIFLVRKLGLFPRYFARIDRAKEYLHILEAEDEIEDEELREAEEGLSIVVEERTVDLHRPWGPRPDKE
jgi:hypothetical protein